MRPIQSAAARESRFRKSTWIEALPAARKPNAATRFGQNLVMIPDQSIDAVVLVEVFAERENLRYAARAFLFGKEHCQNYFACPRHRDFVPGYLSTTARGSRTERCVATCQFPVPGRPIRRE